MNTYGEILTVKGLLTKEECKLAIQEIDSLIELGFCHETPSSLSRKDECIHFTLVAANGQKMAHTFLERLQQSVMPEYLTRFPILQTKTLGTLEIKGQKTLSGGGFHDWHYEATSGLYSNRELVFTMYLNDDFEAGETEFLTLNKRIKPEAGTCVLFPGGFLHTHRGNPPIGGTKYILTGWVIDLDPYVNVRG